MPSIIPIPLPPNEDYDHPHSLESSLMSLQCLVSSFDSTMNSLQAVTRQHSDRISHLTERCQKIEKKLSKLKKLGNEGKAVTLFSPTRLPQPTEKNTAQPTPLEQCRNASNLAILRIQDTFRELDDENAKLCDEWLDRVSGFEEHLHCVLSEENHTVPSIRYNVAMEESHRSMAAAAAAAARRRRHDQNNEGLKGGDDPDDFDDETSAITLETASHMAGGGGGWVSLRMRDDMAMLENTTSRQQADSGSQPFTCELLHDVYGVGGEPSGGDPGEFFPRVRTLDEMRVFHEGTKVYGEEKQGMMMAGGSRGGGRGSEVLLKSDEKKQQAQVGTVGNKDDKSPQHSEFDDQMTNDSAPNVESYRPKGVSDDAGLFQLPEDLPLPDVATVRLTVPDNAAENSSIAPSRFVKKR